MINCTSMGSLLRLILAAVLLPAAGAPGSDHTQFDAILREVVRGERVDYQKIKSDHLPALRSYLAMLAEARPSDASRAEQLAFYINLYNATMIQAVIDRDPTKFKPSDNDFAVFKEKLVRAEGRTLSLNELENDVIRPRFNDPRVHAALVCAAVSCPPILNRAYRADDLDQVLTENVRRWLNDPKRNEIDEANRTLRLSRIFEWYAPDFGGAGKLADFVSLYLGRDVRGFAIEFKEYDWSLNAAG
ncbi:MAG: DUF547 domain-containing protein [Phycisphaerales bacterium]|nr:DUF547 domain-containing protein [Phycisphaerales bacterium]